MKWKQRTTPIQRGQAITPPPPLLPPCQAHAYHRKRPAVRGRLVQVPLRQVRGQPIELGQVPTHDHELLRVGQRQTHIDLQGGRGIRSNQTDAVSTQIGATRRIAAMANQTPAFKSDELNKPTTNRPETSKPEASTSRQQDNDSNITDPKHQKWSRTATQASARFADVPWDAAARAAGASCSPARRPTSTGGESPARGVRARPPWRGDTT